MKEKLFLREKKMSKEDYLQMKKQARVWFTVNIVISLMAIAGGLLVVISKSRHIPFLLMALGALTLMNQVLVTPAFNAPSDSNSLDLNKAKDLAEKAQQQNWLKRGE